MFHRQQGSVAPPGGKLLLSTSATLKTLSRTSGVLEDIVCNNTFEIAEMSDESFLHLNVQDIRQRTTETQPAHASSIPFDDQPPRRSSNPDHGQLVPVIRGSLYFAMYQNSDDAANAKSDFQYFTSSHHERYLPYNTEVGPVDLGVIVSFCNELQAHRSTLLDDSRPLVYYTVSNAQQATNAALLLGCFLMLEEGWSSEATAYVFEAIQPSPFVPFLDASGMEDFSLSLRNCFAALERSVQGGWFSLERFDALEYQRLEHPSGGDVTRIGGKFLAFKGPVDDVAAQQQREAHPPSKYVELFREMGVTAVVRLNEADDYDASAFVEGGIRHYELPFRDCSYPSRKIAKAFLDICDTEGLVAVHCKAGLGRTGTIIALWMMKHRGYPAKEAIAWLRMARPGSVIGPQQTYLEKCERREWVGNWMGKTPTQPGAAPPPPQPLTRSMSVGSGESQLARQFDKECQHRARQKSYRNMSDLLAGCSAESEEDTGSK
mmetsp:Transcript_28229/g.57267  ORF Transcript_28229/g.57267 Transcript_28229/m.57267 type:complete len:490 (+) Transcript_28229:112-1581(+)